jgi:hypothetical protein
MIFNAWGTRRAADELDIMTTGFEEIMRTSFRYK